MSSPVFDHFDEFLFNFEVLFVYPSKKLFVLSLGFI